MWSRKVGVHWLKAHRYILQKCFVLVVLVVVVANHSYLRDYAAGSGELGAWLGAEQLAGAELGAYLYQKFLFDTSASWFDYYGLKKNMLTVPMGPRQGQVLESLDEVAFYDGDPRLTWSVLLEQLQSAGSKPDGSNRSISFSWYDWSDFHIFNKLVSLRETEIDCNFLFEAAFEEGKLRAVEEEIRDVLFVADRQKYNDANWYNAVRKKENDRKDKVVYAEEKCRHSETERPKFNLGIEVHQLDEQCRAEVYELQVMSYLRNHLENPISLTMLDSDKSTSRVFVDRARRSNILQAGYLKDYVENKEHYDERYDDVVFDHIKAYENFLQGDVAAAYQVQVQGTDKGIYARDSIDVNKDDFEVDIPAIIEELEKEKDLDAHDKNYLESLQVSRRTHPALAPKFFQEAPHIVQFEGLGYHRDRRFFKGALVNDPLEHRSRLNALIRNWLKFTKANGFVTWIAHGSLYSQQYNGMTFPWDNDFDVQMPIRHLHLMSRYFNQSVIMEDPREGNGKYFLDVSSSITVRTSGNGFNNIDARFIDIDSGLYVDITGMSVSSTPLSNKFQHLFQKERASAILQKLVRKNKFPEQGEGYAAMDILELKEYADSHREEFTLAQVKTIDKLAATESKWQSRTKRSAIPEAGYTPEERYFMNRDMKVYNCRNNHFVSLEALSPLGNSVYHGVTALIPSKTKELLRNEYAVPKQFGFEIYNGQAFLPALHSWFNFNVLKRFANINSWSQDLQNLKSPINKLILEDIHPLLENMLTLDYDDFFTLCFNAFNVTSYRFKEREIQYDSKLSDSQKRELLHDLREKVRPKLSSPAKDPYLLNYERRMWMRVATTLNTNKLKMIHETVESQVLEEFWQMHVGIHEKKLDLFKSSDESGEGEFDLNQFGEQITEPNVAFEKDPF